MNPAPLRTATTLDADALSEAAGLRLVVCDMDGTLLDGRGEIPDGLWPLMEAMRARGILFAPASGRQYATLSSMFSRTLGGMAFIAENGTLLVRDGVELHASVLDPAFVCRTVSALKDLAADHDLGIVVCSTRGACVERADAPFLREVGRYYRSNRVLDDLSGARGDIIKISVYDFEDSEATAPRALLGDAQGHAITLSAPHWLDLSNADATKGHALARLQAVLGVGPAQTAVFGDYLNDLDMLGRAGLSFAMANAHPDLLARARFIAPPNTEGGVVTTLHRLLAID